MEIWVKDLKTGESWKLDDDENKIVYQKDGHSVFNIRDLGRIRFFPFNPDEAEKEREGYQLSIFDYEL